MTRILVVTHCYAEHVKTYAEHLRVQITSMARADKRNAEVELAVCYTPSDEATALVREHWREDLADDIGVTWIALDKSRLFRRAIGRNIAARGIRAEVYWFTDVDYFFGKKTFDALSDLVDENDGLCCPKTVNISTDHEAGDAWVERALNGKRWMRNNFTAKDMAEAFAARQQRVAIGGCQIVGGNVVKATGYLDADKRWQRPVDETAGFRSCRCDRAFRGQVKRWLAENERDQATKYIDVPGVYRIRHTVDGRDYNDAGEKKGKGVW